MRPNLMILETPSTEGISTRKLILEAHKFNVLTASSVSEAVEMLGRFALDGVILPSDQQGVGCGELAARLQAVRPGIIVLVPQDCDCEGDVTHYPPLDPARLVAICRKLFGDPLTAEQREKTENGHGEQ